MLGIKKKVVTVLTSLLCVCTACAVATVTPKTARAEESNTLSISDDFTTLAGGEKSNAYSVSNLVWNAATSLGAVPAAKWSEYVSGGDAELVYKLSAESGQALKTTTLDFAVGAGHEGGVYWHNSGRQGGQDVLGANLIVYVSSDNDTWTSIYDVSKDGTYNLINTEKASDSERRNVESLDITQYAKNQKDIYVKFAIDHFTTEETKIDGFTNNGGIPITRLGINLYSVGLSATQGEVDAISVSSDFTTAGPGTSNLYDYYNVGTEGEKGHVDHGLMPITAWAGNVTLKSGAYLTYKLKATSGFELNSLNVKMRVAYGHDGYGAQYSTNDFIVSVSYDNVTYKDVYSLRNDATIIAEGQTEAKGVGLTQTIYKYNINLDLSSQIEPTQVLYVKIKLVAPDLENVPLTRVGVKLFTTELTAGQTAISSSITYHLNGGVNAETNPDTYVEGTAVQLADASKVGYTFAGWYTESDFVNKVTEISTETTGDVDLYAKYTVGKIYGVSASLNGDIALNFYLELSATTFADETAKIEFVFNGENSEVAISAGEASGDYYKYSFDVAAKDYDKDVTLTLISAEGEGVNVVCSVKAYADRLLEGEYSEETKALVSSLLDYCDSAKAYFADASVEAKFADVTAESVAPYAAVVEGTVPEGVNVLGASLVLESKTAIRVYFTAETVPEVKVNDSVVGVKTLTQDANTYYYVEIENISAKDLNNAYTVEIGTFKVSYSALSYVQANIETEDTAYANVLKAMYLYNQKALAYTESLN